MLCACVEAATGNQWISKLMTMPIAIASSAATIATVSERCLDIARRLRLRAGSFCAAILSIPGVILMPASDGRASGP